MEKSKFSYAGSIARIEEIIARLRDDNPDIDTLAADVKKATDLIAQCRAHLLKTEKEVGKILKEAEK